MYGGLDKRKEIKEDGNKEKIKLLTRDEKVLK